MFFILYLPLIWFFCSCNESKVRTDNYTYDDLEFIAQYNNEFLIQLAHKTIDIQYHNADTSLKYVQYDDTLIPPILYDHLIPTRHMTLSHKKSTFIAQMLPAILIAKFHLQKQRTILDKITTDREKTGISQSDMRSFINRQLQKHDAKDVSELMEKLTMHPVSIILAQAAIESNWGSSRAYSEANNPFHILSKDKADAQLKTFGTNDEIIYIKKYKTLYAAIYDYLKNINRNANFKFFRQYRQTTNNPYKLTPYLESYAPHHDTDYVGLLNNIIRNNNLTQFDNYKIHPDYTTTLSKKEQKSIITQVTEQKKRIITEDAEFIHKIEEETIDIQYQTIQSPEDIRTIQNKYVAPYVYTRVISLKYLPSEEKKQKFIDMLLPSVLVAAHGIKQLKNRITEIVEEQKKKNAISAKDSLFLNAQLKSWKADDVQELLQEKLITRPNSIMLAQAGIESGWGSSRFFIYANNTFGVWSFDPSESRIQARGARNGEPVFLRKYNDLSESIIDYYKVIARGPYNEYRETRLNEHNPYKLVNYLYRYSELGTEYIRRLKAVMRNLELEKYDTYQIDPAYIKVNE